MELGPHANFIWLSYASVAVVISGLIGWLVIDGGRQARVLTDLERRGIRRRSADVERGGDQPGQTR
jgi:heme exporter protein D